MSIQFVFNFGAKNESVSISVQKVYKINGDLRISVSLTDNLRTPIASKDFCTIFQNFNKSGSFYINVEYWFEYFFYDSDSQAVSD